MTVTQLLAEICNRAGEGYQNYTDRAAALFKSTVLSMIYPPNRVDQNAPALCRTGTLNPSADGTSILLAELLNDAGLDEGIIESMRYSADIRATVTTALDDDNDITYTAVNPGIAGNLIGVEYVYPLESISPLKISVADVDRDVDGETVVGKTITVSIEMIGGVTDLDAQTLVDAINNNESGWYVTAELKDGTTGAGQITDMAEEMLIGGVGEGEYYQLERITRQQYNASQLNPNLLNSKEAVAFYYQKGIGTTATIELLAAPQFNIDSNIEYSMIGWDDALVTPVLDDNDIDVSEISTAFAPKFLEDVIMAASALLAREIQI